MQHGRELKSGGKLNRFEDIGVDLNAGVRSVEMCTPSFVVPLSLSREDEGKCRL